MSVYKHPTRAGCWYVKIFHGAEKPDVIPFKGSEDEARAYEKTLRGVSETSDPFFDDMLPEWLVAYQNKNRPNSVESVRYSLQHLREFFGGGKLRHITPVRVEQYKAQRLKDGVKKRTVTVELSALSAYLKWCNEKKPGLNLIKPKLFSRKECKPPMPQVLTIEEILAVFRALDGDVRLAVQLMALCGLRKNEALSLQAKEVDFSGKSVRLAGKGGHWRHIPISYPAILDGLATLCKERPTGPLFVSPRTGLARTDIRKQLARAVKTTGITKHVHPHLFRHSFATSMLKNGVDLLTIQELLGHADIQSTQIYTHVCDFLTRGAADKMAANYANIESQYQQGI